MKGRGAARPSVTELRRRCEAFVEALHREEYQFAAGLKTETDLPDIEKAYSDLASLAGIRAVRKELERAKGDEAFRLFHLLNFLIDQRMEARTSVPQTRLYAALAKAKLRIRDESVPFRRTPVQLASEPDRATRLLIGSEQHRVFSRVNPILLQTLRAVHEVSRQLDPVGHLDLCSRRYGIDLPKLGEAARKLLSATREPYLEMLEKVARDRLRLAVDDLRREDLAYLLGGAEFEEGFPARGMISTAETLLRGMGLDPTVRGRVAYDLEDREGKSLRACTYPIRVPEEIVVSVRPSPGPAPLARFLEEVGQAIHRASIDPELPFEFRSLGSPSIFLASGHLLGRLLLDRVWLSGHPGTSDPEAYLATEALKQTYVVRLLATQLLYELALHGSDAPETQDIVFADLIAEHCSVRFAPEAYLFYTDLQFTTARYLEAWLLESALRHRLVERFGSDWFRKPDVGGFLRDFWKHGAKLAPAELLERFGGKPSDFTLLVEDISNLAA
jgi:hypothetical protein